MENITIHKLEEHPKTKKDVTPPPKLNMSPEKGVSKNSLPTIIFEGGILRDVSSAAEELLETSAAEESKNTQRVFKFNAPTYPVFPVG